MRRKILLVSLAGVVLATVSLSFFLPSGRGLAKIGLPEGGKPEIDPLPITQIVLFNSGVGYVQREGTVDGDADIDLLFNTTDINDLLKSMVLEDLGGGKVSVISYDSSDPVDKILRSFALDLTANPTFGQILNQARGEKIEATIKPTNNAPQTVLKGTIVGMEVRKVETEKMGAAVDVDFLNLLGETGLKSIALNHVEQVRFANPVMEKEFQGALKVLANSHDVQKKRVTLGFKGQGKRKVRLGYVVEKPIWKMTYRLKMEQANKLYMQGWAIVENTSDNDWNNVTMTLVSGKPISFKMDLYEPLYIPRPTVEPDLFASLRPPLYDTTVPITPGMPGGDPAKGPGNMGQMPGQQGFAGQFGGGQFGGGQFGGGQFGGGAGFGQQGGWANNGGFGQFGGQVGGFNGAQFNNTYQNQAQMLYLQNQGQQKQKLTYEELQQNKQKLQDAKQKAKDLGEKVTGLNFKEGIQSVATAEDIGDYFQYRLDQKVTLSRKRSAMLPVFNNTIDGKKISIFNRTIHKRFPLLGLRFKNTTEQPLTQGPITVFDDKNYAGDTRILDVQPDEERLLSYAMDLGTKIVVNYKTTPSPKVTFKIDSDHVTTAYISQRSTKYVVKNDSKHDRLVILEHPIETDWKLVEPTKPEAKTPNHYRFEVEVAKGKSVTYEVKEEQPRTDPASLLTSTKGGPVPLHWAATGIEVKTLITSIPGPKMTFKIGSDQLTATYTNLRTIKYVVTNDSQADRQVILEHPIEAGWKLQELAKPEGKPPTKINLEAKVAKGKSVTLEVLEEQQRADPVSLMTSGKGIPLYSVAAGIEVKPAVKVSPAELVDVKIVKGVVHVRNKFAETRTYFVQNNSEQDRSFTIDHVIPPDWKLIDPQGKPHAGPGVWRFELDVKAGKTGFQEMHQEKIVLEKFMALQSELTSVLQEYINHPAVAKNVKQALEKVVLLKGESFALQTKLAKLKKDLAEVSEDQGRLRDNLKIIPQNSDVYKKFLDKFVKLETQIEQLQDQVRDVGAALEKKTKEYEDYVKNLNAS